MRVTFPTLLIIFIVFVQSVQAQTKESFDFMGSIMTIDSLSYSYRLQLDIVNGTVSGYSITDYLGADETKTEITGTYNFTTKTLVYSESKLVYTKSKYEADLCYIYGKCTLGSKGKTAILQGNFVGKYLNKDTCASGRISLVSSEYLIKNAKKIKKVVSKLESEKTDTLSDYEKVKHETTTLKNGESITYEWTGEKVDLHIWDQGMEDGDKINVYVNGKLVLINYTISKNEKILPIYLNDGDNVISIKALNEGTTFPNTVTVSLKEGSNNYKIVTYLLKDSSAKIIVHKK